MEFCSESSTLKEFLYSTAVYLASENGHRNIVNYLNNLDFTLSDVNEKFTAFYMAARTGQLNIIKYFIEENVFGRINETIIKPKKSDLNIYITSKELNDEYNGIDYSKMLLNASKYGNVRLLELLLNKEVDIASEDENGNTALHYAAVNGFENIAEILLKRGANIRATNKDKNKPIHLAAGNGHTGIVKMLIENGAYINALGRFKNTPLHYSVINGHMNVVEELLKLGAENLFNEDLRRPLHFSSDQRITTLLINHYNNIDCEDKWGYTPLHIAVSTDNVDVLSALLKSNANIESKNKDGYTPLHIAAIYGKENAVKILIENNANIEAKCDNGNTVLLNCLQYGNEDISKLLLKLGADITCRDSHESTLLHIAARTHENMVKYLLTVGFNVDVTDNDLWTPLIDAARNDNIIAGEILLEWNANVNHITKNGSTALHFAAEEGFLNFVNLLLKFEAEILENHQSKTALDIAISNKHIPIQKAIQNYIDKGKWESYS